jgi:hypothetical protein
MTQPDAEHLAHVYWLSGSPCSGKSSIAAAIAQKQGWQVYSCDEAFFRHQKLITPEAQPVFSRVMGLAQEELWMRSVERQVREEIILYQEEFPFILAELLALDAQRPVIAEGAALLPDLVLPYLQDARRYYAIVPSPEFQLAQYSKREWIHDHLNQCSDPQQAFRNWMERDIRFARHARAEAEQRGLACMIVDGKQTIEENTLAVERWFGVEQE